MQYVLYCRNLPTIMKKYDFSSVKAMSLFSSVLLVLVIMPLLSFPFHFSLMKPVDSKGNKF